MLGNVVLDAALIFNWSRKPYKIRGRPLRTLLVQRQLICATTFRSADFEPSGSWWTTRLIRLGLSPRFSKV